jgi:hypothetical protein
MEAKLNSMASRKPADEDYVPGQGVYSTPPARSVEGSPMPEGDLEDEIGDEEGMKAAEDLQREMEAEIKLEVKEEEPSIPPQSTSVTWALPNIPSLPPRPTATPAASVQNNASKPSLTRDEVFKKGLAGLPRKPGS